MRKDEKLVGCLFHEVIMISLYKGIVIIQLETYS